MIDFKKALGAGAATIALAGVTLLASAGPAAAAIHSSSPGSTFDGCRAQYVCVYTGTAATQGPSGPHTDYKYYGYDNFSNLLGKHWIINNQTGGAKVYPCLGYDGHNCSTYTFRYFPDATRAAGFYPPTHYIRAGIGTTLNFTPINSIRLTR